MSAMNVRADLLCRDVSLQVADWVERRAGVALQEVDVENAERVVRVFAHLQWLPSILVSLHLWASCLVCGALAMLNTYVKRECIKNMGFP